MSSLLAEISQGVFHLQVSHSSLMFVSERGGEKRSSLFRGSIDDDMKSFKTLKSDMNFVWAEVLHIKAIDIKHKQKANLDNRYVKVGCFNTIQLNCSPFFSLPRDEIQTLDLKIIRKVFYHCVPEAQPQGGQL